MDKDGAASFPGTGRGVKRGRRGYQLIRVSHKSHTSGSSRTGGFVIRPAPHFHKHLLNSAKIAACENSERTKESGD